jgi:hypothetical protein
MIVDLESEDMPLSDVFVDGTFSAFSGLSEGHIARGMQCIPRTYSPRTSTRPVEESIPRDALLATTKALTEGTPSEILLQHSDSPGRLASAQSQRSRFPDYLRRDLVLRPNLHRRRVFDAAPTPR